MSRRIPPHSVEFIRSDEGLAKPRRVKKRIRSTTGQIVTPETAYPPSPLIHLDVNDSLRVVSRNHEAILQPINGIARIMDDDGLVSEVTFTHTTNSNGQRVVTTHSLGVGMLLSLVFIEDGTAPTDRSIFIQASLTRDVTNEGRPSQLLVSGWLEERLILGWPGSTLGSPTDGKGFLGIVQSSSFFNVSNAQRLRLHNVRVRITTSAVVANRSFFFEMQVNSIAVWRGVSSFVHAASVTKDYFLSSSGVLLPEVDQDIHIPGPIPMDLPDLGKLDWGLLNSQTGDVINPGELFTERWFVGV